MHHSLYDKNKNITLSPAACGPCSPLLLPYTIHTHTLHISSTHLQLADLVAAQIEAAEVVPLDPHVQPLAALCARLERMIWRGKSAELHLVGGIISGLTSGDSHAGAL